jgi:hypothetical protein
VASFFPLTREHFRFLFPIRIAPMGPKIILGCLLAVGISYAADTTWNESHFPNGQLQVRFGIVPDSLGQPQKNGMAQEWYADGTLKSQILWKNGWMEGDALFFHPNGRKAKATHYQSGKRMGFSAAWFASGQKQWEAMFQNDQPNGVWREWHANGKRKMEALYDRGKLNGHATWWYPNGRMQQERDYQQGLSMAGTVKAYDSTGRVTYPVPAQSSHSIHLEESIANTGPK